MKRTADRQKMLAVDFAGNAVEGVIALPGASLLPNN
jgi:hypothetical protein